VHNPVEKKACGVHNHSRTCSGAGTAVSHIFMNLQIKLSFFTKTPKTNDIAAAIYTLSACDLDEMNCR
jgi:hypothetical protein